MTPHLSMQHLDQDRLDDLLIGEADAEAAAHLAACSVCAASLASAQARLASFDAVTLAWSQRRSATLPLQLQPSSSRHTAGSRLPLAIGAAAAAIFALSLPLLHPGSATEATHRAVTQPAVPPQAAAAVAETQAPAAESQPSQTRETQTRAVQIARDNQLLQAIDRELAASETPADLLQVSGPQQSHQSSPDTTRNE